MANASAKLELELKRIGARGFVLSMAPRHRFASPDPGVALWFNAKPKTAGGPSELRVLACDKFRKAEANLYAIALTIDRMRAIERYGAYTMEQAEEGMRPALPPPASAEAAKSWWEVLGVASNWPLDAIEMAYRMKAEKAHPDRGGSAEDMAELNRAIAQARKARDG